MQKKVQTLKNKPIVKILVIICIVYFLIDLFKVDWLPIFGTCQMAVVTDKITGLRYQKSTFVYEFSHNGKMYSGNSNFENKNKVSTKICVVYLKLWPRFNLPINQSKQYDDCKCQ